MNIKKGVQRHLYRCRFIYSAFWAAAAVFVIVCIAREIYPFGTQSVLKIDLYHQYAPYLEEFRSRILTGKSLIYSWETGLGKDFIAQTAYYTTSPLNFLVLFFPGHMISEAVAFLIMLKISLSSASFACYLREHFRKNDISLVIFGLLYAYCAFVTCYYWNFMWLDVVALFPLTALGCEKLILEKKCTLYYVALTLTMIVNFYLSVLVCILITGYAVVIMFTKDRSFWIQQTQAEAPGASQVHSENHTEDHSGDHPEDHSGDHSENHSESHSGDHSGKDKTEAPLPGQRTTHKKSIRPVLLRTAGRFILVSALCAMTSMIILAPVAAALRQTQVSDASFPDFWIYANIWQLISAHFLGARDAVLARNEDMPNIYSGVLTMVLLPLYYTSRKIHWEEKLLYTSFLVFMLLCSCISTLDFMIHGFHFPANLPHRFTFVYSFILLFMAYRGLCEFLKRRTGLHRTELLKWLYGTAVFYVAALFVFEYVTAPAVKFIDRVLSDTDLVLNVIVILVYLFLITLAVRRKISVRKVLLPVLLACVLLETSWSMYQNLKDSGSRDYYIAWMDDTEAALGKIAAREERKAVQDKARASFYRTEFRRCGTINDGALYHYNGFSHFSSLAPGGICTLMEHLGVPAAGNSFRYYDTSPLVDSIFDVRYVLNREQYFPEEDLVWKFKSFEQTGSVSYAENERVLPIGFMTGKAIEDWETVDSGPFEVQNDFVHRAAGIEKDVFHKIMPEIITAYNMEVEDVNEVGDEFSYYLADPYDFSSVPWIHAEFILESDQLVSLFIDASNAARVVLSHGPYRETRELPSGRGIFLAGNLEKGEKLIVEFDLTDKGEFEPCYRESGKISILAAGWDDNAFQEAYDRLSRQVLHVESFQDTKIRGSVTAREDGILFTSIPYTDGWKAFVDQEPADLIGLGENGVIGVPVCAGTHEIVLKYSSPFLLFSVFCSLLGLVFFLIYRKILYRRNSHRTENM